MTGWGGTKRNGRCKWAVPRRKESASRGQKKEPPGRRTVSMTSLVDWSARRFWFKPSSFEEEQLMRFCMFGKSFTRSVWRGGVGLCCVRVCLAVITLSCPYPSSQRQFFRVSVCVSFVLESLSWCCALVKLCLQKVFLLSFAARPHPLPQDDRGRCYWGVLP